MTFLGLFFTVGFNVNRSWFLNFFDAPAILESHFRFYAFHGKPSQRFSESPRRFDNFSRSSPIFVFSLSAVLQECSEFDDCSQQSRSQEQTHTVCLDGPYGLFKIGSVTYIITQLPIS
jgi:hypothetical protein